MSHLRVYGLCRLGRDPELVHLESGTVLCKFNVVTNEKYKDKETTAWNECIAFGKTGENIAKYFSKGSLIMIGSKLTLDTWEKDGKKHSAHKLVVISWEFTGERTDAKSSSVPPQSPTNDPEADAHAAGMDDDDIPF